MKKYFILLFFCSANAFSQVQLEMVFPAAVPDSALTIYTYTDYIIPSEVLVDLPEIHDSESNMKVNLDIDEPGQIVLNIGPLSKKLFVHPNNTYQIILSEDKFTINSKDSINTNLDSVDVAVLEFLKAIFGLESQKSKDWGKEVVSLLQILSEELNQYQGSSFQQALIKYKLAETKAIAFDVIRDKNAYLELAYEYLLNADVQYQNPAYMDFLYDYYFRWFRNFAWSEEKYADVEYGFEIMKSIVDDISDQTIQQLALVNFSKNTYGSNNIEDNSEIIQILDSLSKYGRQEQIKDASAKLLKKFSALQIGSTLPVVKFYDLEGEEFKMSSIDSKYTLLDFWFVGCRPCHESIPYMKKLYEAYGECLEIVSINDRDDLDGIKKYKSNENIDWIFLKGNKNDGAFSLLNVKYYPTFYLIDPHGKLTLTPSGRIDKIFETIELSLKENCPVK